MYPPDKLKRVNSGICLNCDSPALSNRKRCRTCSLNYAAKAERDRRDRQSQGLCKGCGGPGREGRMYCYSCSAAGSKRVTQKGREYRKAILQKLGGTCVCCGITEEAFLCIDHIHGDGKIDRARFIHQNDFYRHILSLQNPHERYRLLCWNCNSVIGQRGYCPHQLSKVTVENHCQ